MRHPALFCAILRHRNLPVVCTLLLSILLFSCNGDRNQSTTPPATTSTGESAPSAREAIYLDGLYATSSATGYDINRLFDSDEQTAWRTQDGAGPDEGIMLYFSDAAPVNVAALEVQNELNTANGTEITLQLYVNGRPDETGKPGDRITLIGPEEGQPLRSIFIRFESTGKEQSSSREVEEELELTLRKFPADAHIGLRSLQLYDDTGKKIHILPPEPIPGKVSASSTLAPEAAYSPANLFDSRKEFVWVEGNKSTAGEGETLKFDFDQAVRISGLKIWNGYLRSEQHRTANARIKECSFGPEGGPFTTFTLRDTPGAQNIEVPSADGSSYELKILSVYPGSRYKDLAISEILFFDGDKPFTLNSTLPARYQSALRTKTGNTPLAGILNRLISNELTQPGAETSQSIVLRSDGTFVLYLSDRYEGSDEAQTLADGNWELLQTGNNSVQVKVFGKLYDMTNYEDYYKGREKKEVTRIFSEILTINDETLSGTDYIRKFYLK